MLTVHNSYTIVMVVHTYHSRLTSMQDYELAVKVKPSGGYETLDFILSFLEHEFVPERESFFLKLRKGASWRYFDLDDNQRAKFVTFPLGIGSV